MFRACRHIGSPCRLSLSPTNASDRDRRFHWECQVVGSPALAQGAGRRSQSNRYSESPRLVRPAPQCRHLMIIAAAQPDARGKASYRSSMSHLPRLATYGIGARRAEKECRCHTKHDQIPPTRNLTGSCLKNPASKPKIRRMSSNQMNVLRRRVTFNESAGATGERRADETRPPSGGD